MATYTSDYALRPDRSGDAPGRMFTLLWGVLCWTTSFSAVLVISSMSIR